MMDWTGLTVISLWRVIESAIDMFQGCGLYLEEAEETLLMIAVGILFAVCFIDVSFVIY